MNNEQRKTFDKMKAVLSAKSELLEAGRSLGISVSNGESVLDEMIDYYVRHLGILIYAAERDLEI